MHYLILDLGTTLKGSCDIKGFEGKIELTSYSHNASKEVNTSSTAGQPVTGATHVSQFEFTKQVDLSTTELYQYCVKGTPLPTAKLHVGRNEGGVYKPLLTYEFTNCFISSVSTGGGGGLPQDTLSLKAETVKCAYAAMENDGKAGGNNVWGWNLKADTEIQ